MTKRSYKTLSDLAVVAAVVHSMGTPNLSKPDILIGTPPPNALDTLLFTGTTYGRVHY